MRVIITIMLISVVALVVFMGITCASDAAGFRGCNNARDESDIEANYSSTAYPETPPQPLVTKL